MDFEFRRAKAATIGKTVRAIVGGSDLELRDSGDGALHLTGYASMTGNAYDMGWYQESIRSGSFTKTLSEKPDVQLLVNHGGLPLARTMSGTLVLSEDDRGLAVDASLDPEDPDVSSLVRKMRRGDIDQMSFAFRATRQNWDEAYENREITEVNIDRGDVSVVNQGANPATFAQIVPDVSAARMFDAFAELRAGATLSSDTLAVLQKVLDLVSSADDAVDQAQIDLSTLMGVPNPDDDDMMGDDADEADDAARATALHFEALFNRNRARTALI